MLTFTIKYGNIYLESEMRNMASMTSAININVNTEVKNEANSILKDLGLNMSTFINMALIQVIISNGIPFEVTKSKPSRQLKKALEEIDEMINNPEKYPRYNNREDLKKALLSDD